MGLEEVRYHHTSGCSIFGIAKTGSIAVVLGQMATLVRNQPYGLSPIESCHTVFERNPICLVKPHSGNLQKQEVANVRPC